MIKKLITVIKFIAFFSIAATISSCSQPDPYLYDTPGFSKGNLPRNAPKNPNAPVKVVPDYYYRQPKHPKLHNNPPPRGGNYQVPAAPVPTTPYGGGSGVQNYYYPNPGQGQARGVQSRFGQKPQTAGSRFYSNPYAIPPSGSAYPYYDSDQYYTPPTYYNNVEPVQRGSRYQGNESGDHQFNHTNAR